MADPKEVLKKWTLDFVKSRDAFFRKIKSYEQGKDPFDFIAIYKDGKEQRYAILPDASLFSSVLEGQPEDSQIVISTLNNKKNREQLILQWKKLSACKFLVLYFANPFASGEKKWVLMPYTHSKVCDDASLGTGFSALSELVEDISLEEIQRRSE